MTAAAMATTATVEAARTTRRLYPRRFETNAGGADRSVGRTSRSMVRPPLQRANVLSGPRRIGGWMAGFLSGSRRSTA
jgi:hypothetical protein